MTALLTSITADSLVEEIVADHPETILIFARHRLKCAGCYIAPFHTLADVGREYAIGLEPLLGDLNRAIELSLDPGSRQAAEGGRP